MYIEPDLRLALALHNSPGVYALLLGSGMSSAAGIPTGWQVAMDLIRKIAVLQDVELADDTAAEKWYRDTFNVEPDYSELLDALTSTSEERQQLLRSYFEPTDAEREDGKKIPTDAHRAIARMVRNENIRVILTTNFDRLLEQALQDEGIQPDVISSADALNGAIPYIHSKVFVVKLHGDYRDTRLLNTGPELATYPEEVGKFLDEVFDRFGLVVCGWSATWDVALRESILRAPNRRFTAFWLSRGAPSEEAQTVIDQRDAEIIAIDGADSIFAALDEKLESLRDLDAIHPMSIEVAVATVKRYLAEDRHRIRLEELMRDEVENVFAEASIDRGQDQGETLPDAYLRHLGQLEHAAEKLCRMGIALVRYGNETSSGLLRHAVERLFQVPHLTGSALEQLQRFPVLLLVYSVGTTAVHTEDCEALAELMVSPTVWQRNIQMTSPAIEWLAPAGVLESKLLPQPHARNYASGSNYLHSIVRPLLMDCLPDDDKYTRQFDLFDALLGLVCRDVAGKRCPPFGGYVWRWRHGLDHTPLRQLLESGADRGLLAAGFFGGSRERLETTLTAQEEWLQGLG